MLIPINLKQVTFNTVFFKSDNIKIVLRVEPVYEELIYEY